MSFMQKIRGSQRLIRWPIILVILALCISLVGFFAFGPQNITGGEEQGSEEDNVVVLLEDEISRLQAELQAEPQNEKLLAQLAEMQGSLGNYYLQQGKEKEAKELLEGSTANLEKSLQIKPQDSSLWSTLGYVQLNLAILNLNQQKDNEAQELMQKSLDSLQKAFNLNPNDLVLANNLAYIAFNAGNPELAEKTYQTILEKDFATLGSQDQKYYIDTLINYGAFRLAKDDDQNGAKELFEKALSLGPDENQETQIRSYLENLNEGEDQ
jgi:tetratricopeptide (TPR) repeat protein